MPVFFVPLCLCVSVFLPIFPFCNTLRDEELNRLVPDDRIAPASHRCHSFHLARSPGVLFVLIDWCFRFQNLVDDAPCFFHVIFPGEQSRVSFHRSSQYSLVSVHVTGARGTARHHLNRLRGQFL